MMQTFERYLGETELILLSLAALARVGGPDFAPFFPQTSEFILRSLLALDLEKAVPLAAESISLL
jgi:hypothetical protein